MAFSQALIQSSDPDLIFSAFLDAVIHKGLDLYPAQEEAIMEMMAGKHIILDTPTGSGKSLVASAMHFKAMAEGKRSIYTSPIKALAHEKFFALSRDFGAQNVGLMTGDASINRDAPILCCTAEIVANLALAGTQDFALDYVIMDEFHFYSDRDRGMAWQIPLLALEDTTFLLMSATLGDCSVIESGLEALTHKPVAHVRSSLRPVPLDYQYLETPLHETLAELIAKNQAPIYVVNFTQRECVEQAQNILSQNFSSKEEKQAIQQALGHFRFDTPFGKDMRRFIGHGVGLHHAGLLPKYRLLVEKLAQDGLLKIIMGTDTLGVGINVPIRSVVFTKLCKFDGEKTAILSVRDFKQIAGRAGRKGFDEQGSVYAQAPEHIIENKRLQSRVEDKPGKKRKIVKKKPPAKNFVAWDKATFDKLIEQPAEAMQSRFEVQFALLLTLMQHHKNGYRRLMQLIQRCHDTPAQKKRHRRQAKMLFRSLLSANILTLVRNRKVANRVQIHADLGDDFSLHHTLTLYLVDTLRFLDKTSEDYACNVLSLVESILENPHIILARQIDKLKDKKMAEMRAEGLDYQERINELEKIEHPKPLGELIYQTFNAYADSHPWVGHQNIYPKSVARDIFERFASFTEYTREYQLQRQEGILLRYLSGVVRALTQSIPEGARTEALDEISIFLRTQVSRIDSSLLSEWSELTAPQDTSDAVSDESPQKTPRPAQAVMSPQAVKTRVRTELHQLLKALASQDFEEALGCIRQTQAHEWTSSTLQEAFQPFLNEYGQPILTPMARHPQYTHFDPLGPHTWRVQQTILDQADDNLWALYVVVDLDLTPEQLEQPIICLERIG